MFRKVLATQIDNEQLLIHASPRTLARMLDFMYSQRPRHGIEMSVDECIELLQLALQFQIQSLINYSRATLVCTAAAVTAHSNFILCFGVVGNAVVLVSVTVIHLFLMLIMARPFFDSVTTLTMWLVNRPIAFFVMFLIVILFIFHLLVMSSLLLFHFPYHHFANMLRPFDVNRKLLL